MLELLLSPWHWRRMEILISHCCSDLRFEVGVLTPCSLRNTTWEGTRSLLWTNNPLMDLGSLTCASESSHKWLPADRCVFVEFRFLLVFLDSIYKNLTCFLGKFWARIKYSSDHRGGTQGLLFPTCTVFTLSWWFLLLQLNWILFFMHVFQKIEVSINVIKKIIFFY